MSLLAALSFLTLSFHTVFADPFFTSLRNDTSVPEECRDVEMADFGLPVEKFTVGRKGALAMGFTFEYPVTRSNASVLWDYFKSLTKGEENLDVLAKIKKDSDLNHDYQVILSVYKEQGFDFGNEGEVLEALAIQALYQEFPENFYFITGSIEYHEAHSPMTIGELDVFVGRRDDCTTAAVGEAKLGKALGHANSQLRRFEKFLIRHEAPPMLGEYEPKQNRVDHPGAVSAAQ